MRNQLSLGRVGTFPKEAVPSLGPKAIQKWAKCRVMPALQVPEG